MQAPGDLAAITTLFHFYDRKQRLKNYRIFAREFEKLGIPLWTAELTFDGHFDLEPSEHVLQIKGKDILWQKERLFNLLLERVPRSFTKIAWLDSDIIFENPFVMQEASKLLQRYPCVQLFSHTSSNHRENRDHLKPGILRRLSHYCGPIQKLSLSDDHQRKPIGAVYQQVTQSQLPGSTGLAWAIRRDILDRCGGFYDRLIVGSGDAAIWAAIHDERPHILQWLETLSPSYAEWRTRFRDEIQRQLSYVPGTVRHLYHGPISRRKYNSRNKILLKNFYDPEKDTRISENGALEWASKKPVLHEEVCNYFIERQSSLKKSYDNRKSTQSNGTAVCILIPPKSPYDDSSHQWMRHQVRHLPFQTYLLRWNGTHYLYENEKCPLASKRLPYRIKVAFSTKVLKVPKVSLQNISLSHFLNHCSIGVVLSQGLEVSLLAFESCRRLKIAQIAQLYTTSTMPLLMREQDKSCLDELFLLAQGGVSFTTDSHELSEQLIHSGLPAASIQTLLPPVQVHLFDRPKPDHTPPTFIWAGSDRKAKSSLQVFLGFMQALKQEPSLRLIIIGNGEFLDAFQRTVSFLGISHSVILLGRKNSREVAEELRNARAALITHNPEEDPQFSTPLFHLEAMVSGTAVIAPRQSVYKHEITHEKTGLLIDSNHAVLWSEAILRLARDPLLAHTLGANGRSAFDITRDLIPTLQTFTERIQAVRSAEPTVNAQRGSLQYV